MSMTRITSSVEVNAPLADAWRFASDWRHWDSWWVGVSGFRPTTELTRGNGTRYAYRSWAAGLTVSLETEIHDFVEHAGWRGVVTKGPPHRTQWIFEDLGTGTRFTYILEYRLPIPLLGSLLDALLMRPAWQRRLDESLRNLKRHFEAGPGATVAAPESAGG
jgi:hypothetical protein